MEYRLITTNEIDDLVEMRIKYLKEDFKYVSEESFNVVRNNLPEYFKSHINKDLFAFGAFCGGKIISTAILLIIEKPCNPRFINGRTGEVFNVYTLDEYRRQGAAYNLLKMLMEFAEECKLDLIELKAAKDGYPLYKRLGFYESNADYIPMKFNFIYNEI